MLEYLDQEGIPYQRVELESPEGQKLAEVHGFLALPGILVNGESINPYEILIRGVCQIDENKAKVVFTEERKTGVL